MEETEKAYLAGIIDSESCITITNSVGRSHQLVLNICMVDKPVIEYLAKLTSSNMRVGRITTSGKQSYQIALSGRGVQQVLQDVKPYIIGKRNQVDLALMFPMMEYGCDGISDETYELRNEIMGVLRMYNHGKGRAPKVIHRRT